VAQRRFYELVTEEGNPYPSNSDVSAFLAQAQSNGLAAYANILTGIRQLGSMSESARDTAAANLLAQNNNLTGSATYQTNEKAVNEIFLQTVAIGNFTFSEPQIASLENIAALCPLSDGEAVLRARAMLNLLETPPVTYDDIAICNGGERSNRQMPSGHFIRVYPNPTYGSATIDYKGIGESGGHFLIFNSLGQVVREIALAQDQGNVQISLGTLSEGIYWYALSGSINTTGKLIINR